MCSTCWLSDVFVRPRCITRDHTTRSGGWAERLGVLTVETNIKSMPLCVSHDCRETKKNEKLKRIFCYMLVVQNLCEDRYISY